jgi:hypothetical protein
MNTAQQSVSQTPLFYYYHLLMRYLKNLKWAQGSEENSAAVSNAKSDEENYVA